MHQSSHMEQVPCSSTGPAVLIFIRVVMGIFKCGSIQGRVTECNVIGQNSVDATQPGKPLTQAPQHLALAVHALGRVVGRQVEDQVGPAPHTAEGGALGGLAASLTIHQINYEGPPRHTGHVSDTFNHSPMHDS